MVGVCITLIGIVRLIETHAAVATMADNIAAVGSVIFLFSALLSYVSLRTQRSTTQIERLADVLFLAGLVLLVTCGIMLAWEIGQSSTTQSGLPPSSH